MNIDADSTERKAVIYQLSVENDSCNYSCSVASSLMLAEEERAQIEYQVSESLESIKNLTPNCDKLDYALSASIGVLCSAIDIFLVGKPGESVVGDITDNWFAEKTKAFAKKTGWDDKKNDSLSSAVRYLEKKFKVPYDQSVGDAASEVFNLTPSNHHFKSLAHNPSLVGLFFSVLDQFNNSSHFVSDGRLIELVEASSSFELRGNNIPSKLFCAFVNWIGHLISDISGSSTSKGRGMGIPSPLWTWTNDIIAIKEVLHIPSTQFDKSVNELALSIFEKGYDARFQAAQAIPVFINETLVRVVYSIRRLVGFFARVDRSKISFSELWEMCEPFSNATVKRMLTVAHGVFCLIDVGDATIRGFAVGAGSLNVEEFIIRINIVGIGRLSISLYGEVRRGILLEKEKNTFEYLEKKKRICDYYIEGLKVLSEVYDDNSLVILANDLRNSDSYIELFQTTVALADKRGVPDSRILRSKSEIDLYFLGDEE